MPLYGYDCPGCGGFAASRPLAAFAEPAACPGCGAAAPRALARPVVPALAPALRAAHATNERSREAPRRHAPGCGCCGTRKADTPRRSGARPWMLSH